MKSNLSRAGRIGAAARLFLLGCANHIHAAIFGHMARTGLVAFAVDEDEVKRELKRIGDEAMAEVKKTGTLAASTKEAVDKVLIEHNTLAQKHTEALARINELEQKQDRGAGGDQVPEYKSIGERVVESEGFKSMDSSARKSMRVQMERKDLLNVTATTGAGTSSANALVGSTRVPGVIAPPTRTMTIRQLLMPGTTDAGSIEYVVETGFTNNAANQVEGAAKGRSNITFNLKTAPVRTIAHFFKASRQLLDDARGLASYIDGRATYGLQFKEEQQLLSGDGTGANILGILPQATAFAPAFTPTGATPIDRLRLAILQAVLAEYPATGFVLNPIDWAKIELTKDADGRYIVSQPRESEVARLWGLPVAETQAMAQNTFLTGAFSLAAQIFDRMEIEVLLSTENEDDFIKNMVTIRAEERLALAVYRPEAFVTGLVVQV
jgi:HK97 family phage major capsid protein